MYRNSQIRKIDIAKGILVLPRAIKTPCEIINTLNPITEYV